MFRHFIVLFLILLSSFSFGQVVLTQTQNDASIGLDRKAWSGLGNTSPLSDGYAHDFTLPASTFSCQQITGILVEISLSSYSNNNTCPHFETYYNLFYGCTPYAGGATCLPASNLIAEPNYAPNTSPPPFNFGNPLGSPINPNIIPDFGDNLSVDIIPVSNPGCNPVTNGFISYEYTITVTVTVTSMPISPPNVNCWDDFQFDTTSCTYVNQGTAPTNPGNVNCWDDYQLDTTSCTYINQGTAPTNPGNVNCWDDYQLDTTSCTYVNQGTAPTNPGNVNCWDDYQLDTTSCTYINQGTAPTNPGNVNCWDDYQLDTTSCTYVNQGTAPTNPGNVNCWDDYQLDTTSCTYVNQGTAPTNPGNVNCWDDYQLDTTSCTYVNQGTAPTNPGNVNCWDDYQLDTTSCTYVNQGTAPTNPGNVNCWDDYQLDTTSCTYVNQGTAPTNPGNVNCWDDYQLDTTSCTYINQGTAPTNPGNVNCWDDYQLDTTSCTYINQGTAPTNPGNVNCWDDFQLDTTTCTYINQGTAPINPGNVNCWDDYQFNIDICEWENVGVQSIATLEEDVILCEEEDITLFANTTIVNPDFLWDSGEITDNITVSSPGLYTVEITDGCSTNMINFQVTQIDKPVIETVVSNGSNIIVETTNAGDFLYSLDGVQYQSSNTFFNVENGLYVVYVKNNNCDYITFTHFHFSIPKFFTPNNDGINDYFNLNGIENYNSSEVYIFDRHGKLLKSSRNSPFVWDGTFNNQELPTTDYWYCIIIDNQEIKGHFTLKR